MQNPGIVTLYDADVVTARTADRANTPGQRRAVQRGEKLTLGKPEFEVFC